MPPPRVDELTQDELVAALVAGAELSLPSGQIWAPLDEPIRRVLHGIWPDGLRPLDRNASSDEARDILVAVQTADALPTWHHSSSAPTAEVWRLIQVDISHFGGVNGPLGGEPVVVEVPKEGLLIYGRNGSGKTSLFRAVVWAITGRVFDADGTDKPAQDVHSAYTDPTNANSVSIPTIVPFPTNEQLIDPSTIQLPEVILTLQLEDERALKFRRILTRSGQRFSDICSVSLSSDEALGWSETDGLHSAVGIPQQSLENSALQVGRLERLNPSGTRNPLASGIEQPTGLAQLAQVCERLAGRLSAYVSGQYANRLESDADRERQKIADSLDNIRSVFGADIVSDFPVGDTSTLENCKQHLDNIDAFLVPRRTAADRALTEVLGLPEDQAPPVGIKDELIRARDELAKVDAENRIEDLLSAWATEEKIQELRQRADEFASKLSAYRALQEDQTRKIRNSLYARIEKWAEDENQPPISWLECPVCVNDLTDRIDPLLNEPIREAAMAARQDAHLLREEAVNLDLRWSEELSSAWAGCPGVEDIQLLARNPELTAIASLRNREDLLGLVARRAMQVPLEDEDATSAPQEGEFARIDSAINMSRSLADCLEGIAARTADVRDGHTRILTEIDGLLDQVQLAVRTHEPIRSALAELSSTRNDLANWESISRQLMLARAVGPSLAEFGRVRSLIDQVVEYTLGAMQGRAINVFYRCLYRAPWIGQPEVREVTTAADSRLDIQAAIEEVTGDGSRLLSHSHLRSVLLAFAGALKESGDRRAGGIDVLLMDDPQTLVDEINRDGLASWLKMMRTARSRPVLFTHSDAFACVAEAKLETARVRVRPSSMMRGQGQLWMIGGANKIERLSAEISLPADESLFAELCAEIRLELEDRLRLYCDAFGIEIGAPNPTLYSYRTSLIEAKSQPAFRDRLSVGAFADLLNDRYIKRADEIAGRIMDALNEAHHAPRENVTEQVALRAKDAWKQLLPLLLACDRVAFDALNAPRVLPQEQFDPARLRVPTIPVTAAVAALRSTHPDGEGNWQPLQLGECRAVRVRRGYDWLPGYVRGGDILLLSSEYGPSSRARLLFVRHFKPAPSKSVALALGMSGKSEGRHVLWGAAGKSVVLEQPYEVETVCAILFSPPDVQGESPFTRLSEGDIDFSGFRAAPIIGDSAEPFLYDGDQVLIKEGEQVEAGTNLVDERLYLLETADHTVAVKRFDKLEIGTSGSMLFQPIGANLGGSGTAMLAYWPVEISDDPEPGSILGLWPIRGFLFST